MDKTFPVLASQDPPLGEVRGEDSYFYMNINLSSHPSNPKIITAFEHL